MQTLLIFFIDVPQLKGFAQDVHVQQAFLRQFRAVFNPLPGNQIDVKHRRQVQNTGHKSQVTGHCFTNTESIPNTCKKLTLGLKVSF